MSGPGHLTLIGSGELAPSMSRVHRAVSARIEGPPRAVFIDTPAGFEPNVNEIGQKAIAYFDKHLGIACDVATYRHASTSHPNETDAAVRRIRRANYVFAGPGSPTYAVRNWRGTPVLQALAERLEAGAEVVLASAAAIASGTYALPVYEIYKSGDDLSWHEGCSLLDPYGIRLAIVPHWNNAEGGGHDTRFCYMGKERFDRLRAMLDPSISILGLDEYTACGIDFGANRCEVMGAGAVTLINRDEQAEFGAGESFPLDLLRQGEPRSQAPAANTAAAPKHKEHLRRSVEAARRMPVELEEHPALTAAALLDLAEAIERGNDAGEAELAEARGVLEELLGAWSARLAGSAHAETGPLVGLLIDARRELRDQKAFQAADAIRDGLAQLGVILEDSRDGTTWRSAPA